MASGDIKRIFDFGDPVLIHEAVAALFNDISQHAKKQKIDIITGKNHTLIPTLSLLWDTLSDSDPVASRACGCVLQQLVTAKVMDGHFAQQQLLNVSKLAKCQNSVLQSLTDILVASLKLDSDSESPAQVCQHPLVLFCRIRPSMITDVLACFGRIGSAIDFSTIELPISFLLLAPDLDVQRKSVIFSWLAHHVEQGGFGPDLIWKICRYIPQMPGLNPLSLILKLESLKNRLIDVLPLEALEYLTAIGTIGNTDVSAELEYLGSVVQGLNPEALKLFSLRFSSWLLRLPYDYWKPALKIVEYACKSCCPLYATLFFASLVNLNSMAGQLRLVGLSDEEFLILPKLIQSCLMETTLSPQRSVCTFHKGHGALTTLLDVLCQFPETIAPFLSAMERTPPLPTPMTLNVLSSLLITHQSDKAIATACCKVVIRTVTEDPAKVSLVLPAFIQAASKELARTELVVLDWLPKLAVHHLCIPPVLRFVLGLANNPKLRTHGYRLLAILFERQPSIYRHIKPLLDDVATVKDEELLVLKMELLLVVCKFSGAEHGSDLIPLLQSMINKREATSATVAKSLTLTILAFGELCRCEELQPDVMWRKLYGKFGNSTGQMLSTLCDFAGILGEIADDSEDLEPIKGDILQFLWTLASSSKIESECRASVLKALSKFDYRTVDRSHLGIKVPESDDGAASENGIPGDLVFAMFDSLKGEHFDDFSAFLSKLILAETELLGRGAYYNAKLMASRQSASSSSLEDFCNTLCAKCSQGAMPEKDTAAAVLLIYEPPEELSQRGGDVRRKSTISAGRHYLRMLVDLLKTVPFGDVKHWRQALVVPFGWSKFMERLYSALIAGRQAELELQTTKGAKNQDENALAHLWARDKIVENLKTTWRQDGGARANCCIALAALGLAVKNHSMSNVQVATTPSNIAYIETSHWIVLAVETLCGLASTGYSPISQDLIFETLEPISDSAIISASRLGASILLPAVRDDVMGFYGEDHFERFGSALTDGGDASDQSTTDSTAFYNLLSRGFYCGEHARQGAMISHVVMLSSSNYKNPGGWLGAAIFAVFADDVSLAESLLNVMIPVLEAASLSPVHRQISLYAIGLIATVVYPDPTQFIRSDLYPRLVALSSGDSTIGTPGFVSKIYGTADKDKYRQSVSASLGKITKENTALTDITDDFEWLTSSCGADYFPLAFVGRLKKLDADDRTVLNELCKVAKKRLLSSEVAEADQPARNDCLLALATVAFSTKYASSNTSEATLPADYSYLDESSVLRHSVAFLIGSKAEELRIRSVLQSLSSSERTKALPPLDCDRVYDALDIEIRTRLDEDVVCLAVKERSSSLLSKLTHPTLLVKLSSKAKIRLLENLHIVAECLPTNNLKRLFRVFQRFRDGGEDQFESFLTAAFKGLRSAFKAWTATEKEQSISPGNLAALFDWCLEAGQTLSVESYNDFRTRLVQHFVDAVAEFESAKLNEVVRALKRRSDLLAFSVWVSGLLRHRGGKLGLDKLDVIVEAYGNIANLRASALRILLHELAGVSSDEKEKEAAVLHLMNSTLLLYKRSYTDQRQILAVFDVFLGSIAVWFQDEQSLPPYLMDGTKLEDQLNAGHDAQIVQTVLFTDVARQFATCLMDRSNQQLIEKVIDWAIQLLPMLDDVGDRSELITGLLHCLRSTEYYRRKLQDPAVIDKVLAFGMDLKS